MKPDSMNALAEKIFQSVKAYIDRRLPETERDQAKIGEALARIARLEREVESVTELYAKRMGETRDYADRRVAETTALLTAQVGELRARAGIER